MGWRSAVLAVGGCLLLVGTGCPEEWRKGGINDRAIRKDNRQRLNQDRPEAEDEDEPSCPEGTRATWTCEASPCRWVCK